jgi:thymidylate synthase (FAD)
MNSVDKLRDDSTVKLRDALTLLKGEKVSSRKIKCLDDGFVQLVDCMPRLIPEDRTCEFRIVESARVSYGQSLKDKKTDENLLRYLFRHSHTSPFEGVKFTFYIRCPKFVAIQLLRHRTANVNEYSQRYSVVREGFYHPSQMTDEDVPGSGVRVVSSNNKQGSESSSCESLKETIKSQLAEVETLLNQVTHVYDHLISLGCAKEVARFCLPMSMYTELYYTMDLNNLIKFLALRQDRSHAQPETVVFADAIHDLIEPLVPITMEMFNEYKLESLTLSKSEIEAITQRKDKLDTDSVTGQREYQEKLRRLGLQFT